MSRQVVFQFQDQSLKAPVFVFSADVSLSKIMNPCCSAADLTCVTEKCFSEDELSSL